MKKIRTAVVGFGFMGTVHAGNILERENMELCAIVDNRPELFRNIETAGNAGRLKLPVEQLRTIPVFPTLEECARTVAPDAAVICVPLFLHFEMVRRSLNAGLDVLVEKPFCPEEEQCRELIALAREKKRILMVAHCVRFAPEWEYLAECIRSRRLGELRLLSACRMGGEPGWGVWRDPGVRKTCGGALMDMLIHDIDFLNSCFGAPEQVELYRRCGEFWEIGLGFRGVSAAIGVRGGFLYPNSPFSSEYAATFAGGGLRCSTFRPGKISIGVDSGAEDVPVAGDMYKAELAYFADCVEKRTRPEKCLPESSLQAIRVCRELQRMARERE